VASLVTLVVTRRGAARCRAVRRGWTGERRSGTPGDRRGRTVAIRTGRQPGPPRRGRPRGAPGLRALSGKPGWASDPTGRRGLVSRRRHEKRRRFGGDAVATGQPADEPHDPTSGAVRAGDVRRGRSIERSGRPRGRRKPLKGEPQGRYRRETEPGGPREEQNAKRRKKPGGVAQPGEASPV
jgi:hypothetical protein